MALTSGAIPYTGVPTQEPTVSGSGATPDSTRTTPDSFGAGVGGAIEHAGAEGEQVANKYMEMANHTAANDTIVNKYVPQVNDLVSNYKKLQGTDAIAQLPAYQAKLQEINNSTLAGLPKQQQLLVGDFQAHHSVQTMGVLSNHMDSAYEKHEVMVNQQTQKMYQDQAIDSYNNPNAFSNAIGSIEGTSRRYWGTQLDAEKDKDIIDQKVKEDTSGAVKSSIMAALDNNDVDSARHIYDNYSDSLSGKEKLSVMKLLTGQTVASDAKSIVNNLLGGAPAVVPGTGQHADVNTKADLAALANQNGIPVAVLSAIHGVETNYGANKGSIGDDFQTIKSFRDVGFQDNSIQSSAHNAAKIWKENGASLTQLLDSDITPEQNYVAYNQGGGGAAALYSAGQNETAAHALARNLNIPYESALKRVTGNGGTATMSAKDFTQHLEDVFNTHYDANKITVPDDKAPDVIRNSANVQMPAIQEALNPVDYRKQLDQKLPDIMAYADAIPNEATQKAVYAEIRQKVSNSTMIEKAWKNNQADIANQYRQDDKYTSPDQIPASVKSDLVQSGQWKALTKDLAAKPHNDKSYGSGFMDMMQGVASSDIDVPTMAEVYGQRDDLRPAGFIKLQKLLKNASTPEGKATLDSQVQFLSNLQKKMIPEDFEKQLPAYFAQWNDANIKDKTVLTSPDVNKNPYLKSLALPHPAELTADKIKKSLGFFDSLYAMGQIASYSYNNGIPSDKDFEAMAQKNKISKPE